MRPWASDYCPLERFRNEWNASAIASTSAALGAGERPRRIATADCSAVVRLSAPALALGKPLAGRRGGRAAVMVVRLPLSGGIEGAHSPEDVFGFGRRVGEGPSGGRVE